MGDYPTEDELKTIREWPIEDPEGWFRFIHSIWWARDWGWREAPARDELLNRSVQRYSISTGGWSGNEDIIDAMGQNLLWAMTWMSSRRGGHYVFERTVEVE